MQPITDLGILFKRKGDCSCCACVALTGTRSRLRESRWMICVPIPCRIAVRDKKVDLTSRVAASKFFRGAIEVSDNEDFMNAIFGLSSTMIGKDYQHGKKYTKPIQYSTKVH